MTDYLQPPMCPSCSRVIDATSCVTDEEETPPQEGDLSICGYCAEVLVFKDDRGYSRKATTEDMEEWDEETHKMITSAALAIHRRINSGSSIQDI